MENLLSFRCICCHNEPDILTLVSSTCTQLYVFRSDHEILKTILSDLNIHLNVTSFTELISVTDKHLFSLFISSQYRLKRWKYATNNRPLEAIGECVLLRDSNCAIAILQKEYAENVPCSVIDHILAHALVTGDIKRYEEMPNIHNHPNKEYNSILIEVQPKDWEYAVFTIVNVTWLMKETHLILTKILENKDYEMFALVIEKMNSIPSPQFFHFIACVIAASGNREVYEDLSLLGISETLLPTTGYLENPNVMLIFQTNLEMLQEMYGKSIIRSNSNSFLYKSTTTKIFIWKLQTFHDNAKYIQNKADLFATNQPLTTSRETVEDYIYFVDELSKLLNKTQVEVCTYLCSYLLTYEARDLFKHYKKIGCMFTLEMINVISKSNIYLDNEFKLLLNGN